MNGTPREGPSPQHEPATTAQPEPAPEPAPQPDAAAQPEPDVPAKNVVPPEPGETITSLVTRNSYVMQDEIGEGFFGRVFACTDQWDNNLAAKVLKPFGTYERVRAAAAAEIERLLTLRHPNITYIFDAFEYRDTFYIVTERCLMPIGDLFRMETARTPYWLLPIARCLCQAVHYLHVNNYAHQDIHLGNAFVASSRDEMNADNPGAMTFKLGDLGVSRLISELDAANTLNDAIKPPEARDRQEFGPLDSRMDIYQLGLLLLQLAMSRRIEFTAEEIVSGRPRELALELPPPVSTALEKTLRRHVMHRTADAIELWRDLNAHPGIAGAVLRLAGHERLPAEPQG